MVGMPRRGVRARNRLDSPRTPRRGVPTATCLIWLAQPEVLVLTGHLIGDGVLSVHDNRRGYIGSPDCDGREICRGFQNEPGWPKAILLCGICQSLDVFCRNEIQSKAALLLARLDPTFMTIPVKQQKIETAKPTLPESASGTGALHDRSDSGAAQVSREASWSAVVPYRFSFFAVCKKVVREFPFLSSHKSMF